MVLVHEDSEMLGSDESIVRNTTGNKMKVKLLMNNNTVEVDTPTSKYFIDFVSNGVKLYKLYFITYAA